MTEFWRNSGFRLLQRDDAGFLAPTDAYFRAYLARPELIPVAESCDAERALHAKLVEEPASTVAAGELDALADRDARENFEIFLAFRDRLHHAGSLERCYLSLFADDSPVRMPALFIDQMVHAIARNVFEGVDDVFVLRAAELMFREQVINRVDGAALAMDSETVDMMRSRQTQGRFSLMEVASNPAILKQASELEVLSPDNQGTYWKRSESFDLALDLTFGRQGLSALCEVLRKWIAHFLGIDVTVEPLERINDDQWIWHVGLDRDASALLNDLYSGQDVDSERLSRLLSLFRLQFGNPADQRPDIAGRPVYLALCVEADGRLRMKPQNILVNLPLARPA